LILFFFILSYFVLIGNYLFLSSFIFFIWFYWLLFFLGLNGIPFNTPPVLTEDQWWRGGEGWCTFSLGIPAWEKDIE